MSVCPQESLCSRHILGKGAEVVGGRKKETVGILEVAEDVKRLFCLEAVSCLIRRLGLRSPPGKNPV